MDLIRTLFGSNFRKTFQFTVKSYATFSLLLSACVKISDGDTCPSGQQLVEGICEDCPPGEYLYTGTTARVCRNCPRGTYQPNPAQITCILCPQDVTTYSTGSISQSQCNIASCSIGQYRDPVINVCVTCPVGTYAPDMWREEACESCPQSMTTLSSGSTSLTDCILICNAGLEDDGGVCNECEVGFYKSLAGPEPCVPCPDGRTTSGTGATDPSSCVLVVSGNAPCSPGQYLSAANSGCVLCPRGTYQDRAGQTACFQCPQGSNSRKKTTLAEGTASISGCILACLSGFEYVVSSDSCEPCPQGYYRTEGQHDSCQRCPQGLTTSSLAKSSISDCDIVECPRGQYRLVSANTCLTCDKGTYQPEPGQTSCLPCPDDTDTPSTGSVDQTACIPINNVQPCTRNICHNGGDCSIRDGAAVCMCTGPFGGPTCKDAAVTTTDRTLTVTPYTAPPVQQIPPGGNDFLPYVVGGSLAGLILIITGIIICCMCCKKRRKRGGLLSTSSQSSSAPSSRNQLYGTAPRPGRSVRIMGDFPSEPAVYSGSLPRSNPDSLENVNVNYFPTFRGSTKFASRSSAESLFGTVRKPEGIMTGRRERNLFDSQTYRMANSSKSLATTKTTKTFRSSKRRLPRNGENTIPRPSLKSSNPSIHNSGILATESPEPPEDYPKNTVFDRIKYKEYEWKQSDENGKRLYNSAPSIENEDLSSNFMFYEETRGGPKVGRGLERYNLDVSRF